MLPMIWYNKDMNKEYTNWYLEIKVKDQVIYITDRTIEEVLNDWAWRIK
jgi:hypothetical protein